MRAIAYIASHSNDKEKFFKDLDFQRNSIEYFCLKNKIELGEIFIENNFSKPDFRPTLLKIIKNINMFSDSLILLNKSVLSDDLDFVDWVEFELKKLKIEIIYANSTEKISVHPLVDIQKHINEIVRKMDTIPSLPILITKMFEIIQDEKSSIDDLAELISYDAGLSFKILRLVNSSYYGFERQITTINQALAILGLTTIKGLILSASVFKTVSEKSHDETAFAYKKLWTHNLLTALGTKFLTEKFNIDEDLFACAVLHDVGKFVLAKFDTERFDKACQMNYSNFNFTNRLDVEKKYCGISHNEIGSMLVEKWGLPSIIIDIVKNHHNPNKSEHKIECFIIYIADVLANLVLEKEPLDISFFDENLLEKYAVNYEDIYKIYEKLNLEIQNVDDIDYFFK